MAKKRYGEKERNIIFRWVYIVVFGLVAIWLISSIITKESPADVLRGIFSKMPGKTSVSCEELLVEKDSIIKSLEEQLSNSVRITTGSNRGIVIIESQTLNLRDKPSLNSNILLKIPANSEVEILLYDIQTFYLEGLPGKWCKVKYADSEGWVWGNYIREI